MSESTVQKKKKHRSPAYPSIDLKEAIDKAGILYQKEKRHSIPVSVVAEHFGYDIKSSSALRAIAALKHFGLVTESGASDDRKIKLSDLALDILLAEREDSEKRVAAVKRAALLPDIYANMWKHYNGSMPSDATLKEYLIRDLDFNDSVVGSLISKFRNTLALANINPDDKIDGIDGECPGTVAVGSYVQWTNQGAHQFVTPKRVKELSDDGEWALLDGENTGIAVSELSVVDAPVFIDPPPKPALSENPFRQPPRSPYISFPLGSGNVMELRLTKPVSKKDFDRMKKLIELSEESLVEEPQESE